MLKAALNNQKCSNGLLKHDMEEREVESFQQNLIWPQGPRVTFSLDQHGAWTTRASSSAWRCRGKRENLLFGWCCHVS